MHNNLKQAIDTDLRCLRTTQRERNTLFTNTLEGRKVKKKLSAGFILVMVLILTAVAALAATLIWEDYAAEVKQIEHEQGEYEQWPLDEKLSLIRNLIDMGYLEENADTAKLFSDTASQEDRQTLADAIMLELTGQKNIHEINLDIITYAILGPENTWTSEQRVWWMGITNMYREADDPDTLITPGGGEISEEDAIAIAKAAILEAYGLDENALDNALPVADLYVTDQRPDYKRWNIQFQLFKEGTDNYLVRSYIAIVDENGNVIADPDVNMASVEDRAAEYNELMAQQNAPKAPIAELFMEYLETQGYNQFKSWPLDVKAAYSQEVRPLVQEALETGELLPYDDEGSDGTNKAILESTVYAYGLPGEGDVQETEALVIAEQVLTQEFGSDTADYLFVYSYYDITDPDHPLWKFVFYPQYPEDDSAMIIHRVELDGHTGELLLTDAFERDVSLNTLEYALKWH